MMRLLLDPVEDAANTSALMIEGHTQDSSSFLTRAPQPVSLPHTHTKHRAVLHIFQ